MAGNTLGIGIAVPLEINLAGRQQSKAWRKVADSRSLRLDVVGEPQDIELLAVSPPWPDGIVM
jgi:hypothetical protein